MIPSPRTLALVAAYFLYELMKNQDAVNALQHVMLHALASGVTHAGQIPAGPFRMPTLASRRSSAITGSDI